MTEPVIIIAPDITECLVFAACGFLFRNLMDYIVGGDSPGEFLKQLPTVTREIAVQSLEEAHESLLAKIA